MSPRRSVCTLNDIDVFCAFLSNNGQKNQLTYEDKDGGHERGNIGSAAQAGLLSFAKIVVYTRNENRAQSDFETFAITATTGSGGTLEPGVAGWTGGTLRAKPGWMRYEDARMMEEEEGRDKHGIMHGIILVQSEG